MDAGIDMSSILIVFVAISALVGFGITIPVLLQFVNNVSRNMSLTNTNSTEAIKDTAVDTKQP
jgi:hypothetical protein